MITLLIAWMSCWPWHSSLWPWQEVLHPIKPVIQFSFKCLKRGTCSSNSWFQIHHFTIAVMILLKGFLYEQQYLNHTHDICWIWSIKVLSWLPNLQLGSHDTQKWIKRQWNGSNSFCQVKERTGVRLLIYFVKECLHIRVTVTVQKFLLKSLHYFIISDLTIWIIDIGSQKNFVKMWGSLH